MIVGERCLFSAVSPVEQPTLRRQACDCGRGLVEGEGHAGPLLGSDFEPAPSAKRNRRPMRGAFRSSRFVLPFCGVARAVAPASPQGRSIGGYAPSGLGGAWGGAPPSAAIRQTRPAASFDAARQGSDPPDSNSNRVGRLRGFGSGQRQADCRRPALERCPRRRRRLQPLPYPRFIRIRIGDGGASITTPTRRSICWWRWG